MWERIPEEVWRDQRGHVERYELAAALIHDGETVLDAACGIGYGARVLVEMNKAVTYHGADFPGVPSPAFATDGTLHGVNLDTWEPDFEFDVALCFETLEHLRDPARWAAICKRARRLVIVSVPTVPTKHLNPYHLHDFTVEEVLELLTPAADVDVIAQPHESSHVFVAHIN